MEDQKVFISAEVPKSLGVEARVAAAKMNISRSEFVRRAIQAELKRLESKPDNVKTKEA